MIKQHDKSIDVYYFLVIPKSNNTPFFVFPKSSQNCAKNWLGIDTNYKTYATYIN